MFGGLGPLEIIVLLVIFFVLFGAERLPKMANALGRSKGEFQKGLDQSTQAMKALNKPLQTWMPVAGLLLKH